MEVQSFYQNARLIYMDTHEETGYCVGVLWLALHKLGQKFSF